MNVTELLYSERYKLNFLWDEDTTYNRIVYNRYEISKVEAEYLHVYYVYVKNTILNVIKPVTPIHHHSISDHSISVAKSSEPKQNVKNLWLVYHIIETKILCHR